MVSCCNHRPHDKNCKRQDGKTFKLPRKFSKNQCKQPRGFTMKSSCAPYKYCKQQRGGGKGKATSCKGYGNAIAILNQNKDNISGHVRFIPHKSGLHIDYDIKGLKDGEHGFHIHEYGDLSEGCTSACSHFNPDKCDHGGLHSKIRHAGDLGNIVSKDKIAKGRLYARNLSTNPKTKYNIVGRMIIVHEDRDDLGKGGDEESLKTGNAGKRVACGVIGLASKH